MRREEQITQDEYDAIKKYLDSKDIATSSTDLKATLDSMVEKGVITQAQEDAILGASETATVS